MHWMSCRHDANILAHNYKDGGSLKQGRRKSVQVAPDQDGQAAREHRVAHKLFAPGSAPQSAASLAVGVIDGSMLVLSCRLSRQPHNHIGGRPQGPDVI